jgi:DNA-binding FadR family transcriptional regulator
MSNSVPKPPDTTISIVRCLKRKISRGVLKPGQKLPPERELAAEFDVNRASLRQALKALVVMGVLRQRVGDGTYVTARARTILSVPRKIRRAHYGVTVADLFETLSIVEPELAARAIERRSHLNLAQLESAIAAINADSLVTVDLETLVAVFVAATTLFRAIAPPGAWTSSAISPDVWTDPTTHASETDAAAITVNFFACPPLPGRPDAIPDDSLSPVSASG